MLECIKATAVRAAEHPIAMIAFAMLCFGAVCASLPVDHQFVIPHSAAIEAALPIVIPTLEKMKASDGEPAKAPGVQCIVVGSEFCPPCRVLEKKLYDQLTAAGNWKVGREADSHFRFVSIDDVQRKGIKQTPFIYWVVNGDEIPTTEREPAKLAHEYLRLIGKPVHQSTTSAATSYQDDSSGDYQRSGFFNGRFRSRLSGWFPGRGIGRFVKRRFGGCC